MCWAIKNSTTLTYAYIRIKNCFKQLTSSKIKTNGGSLYKSFKCTNKMTRIGHTLRGNQLCVISGQHTIKLNMVNGFLLEILYIRSDTRKSRVDGYSL